MFKSKKYLILSSNLPIYNTQLKIDEISIMSNLSSKILTLLGINTEQPYAQSPEALNRASI